MALQGLRARAGTAAGRSQGSRRACSIVAQAQQERNQRPITSQMLAAGLALGITLSGAPMLAPPPAEAASAYTSLADIVRKDFAFVDEDKNGVITKDELVRTSKQVAEDVDFLMPDETQLDFAMRLFDLNQDGTLATDELLTSIVLDGAVGDTTLDEDVVKVFDKDGDGFVTMSEFRSAAPVLGPNGEAAKEYIFARVDQLVDGDGRLDMQEFANALTLMRTAVLGY